jgi:hypothetical protein
MYDFRKSLIVQHFQYIDDHVIRDCDVIESTQFLQAGIARIQRSVRLRRTSMALLMKCHDVQPQGTEDEGRNLLIVSR